MSPNNTLQYLNLVLLCVCIVLYFKKSFIVFLCLYFILFFILEYLEFCQNIQIWNQKERTENCYNWFEHYFVKNYDQNQRFDYSESLFFGNYNLPIEQATLQKYDYIFHQLELQPGQKLLDCGCGIGTWIEYCSKRGISVVGLTLSEEQALIIEKKGLTVYVRDYRILYPEFLKEFDAITVLGSSEHVCLSKGLLTHAKKCCENTHTQLYILLQKYLKPPHGKIFVTALVMNEIPYSSMDYLQGYIIERHYGGYYITEKNLLSAVTNAQFIVVSKQDFTRDYHWTSVAAPDHFGHWNIRWNEDPFDKIVYFCKGLVIDPFLFHHWLYYFMDTWMWQFGGYQQVPLTDKQIARAPAQLKYLLLAMDHHPTDLKK